MSEKVWTPRVTVAAVVERQGRFLMVRERIDGRLVCNQPAGHLEDDESLTDAVRREVLEETAWHFQPKGLVGIYRWRMAETGRTYLRFCFHGEATDQDSGRPLDPDITDALWLNRDEVQQAGPRSPMVMNCIDDYLAGSRLPLDLLKDL